MKPLRVILIGVGIVVLLLVVAVSLALSSGVQTWAARRALAAQPDVRGEIGRVAVGLQRVQAENVRLQLSGMTLQLPALDADVAVLRAARNEIEIRRLVAKGWTLDLTAPAVVAQRTAVRPAQAASLLPLSLAAVLPANAAAPATAASFPLADILAALELPVDLVRLDGVELVGTVIFPTAPGSAPGRAAVTINGGGLAPGAEGVFAITADAQLQDPAAPVSGLRLQSEVRARLRDARVFAQVATTSTVEAHGGQLVEDARLQINATAGSATDGGSYSLELRRPDKALLEVEARPMAAGSSDLAGNWRLAMDHTDVEPFALGFPLPQFQAQGAGQVKFSGSDQSIDLAGRLQVQADRLEVLMPQLAAVGGLTVSTEFDARRAGDDLRVTQLHAVVAADQPVAEFRSLQGFEFNLATGELRVADPDQDLLDVTVQGLPLAWAQPFLTDQTVTGGPVQGSWRAAARDGGFVLRAVSPLRIGGVTVAQAGQPLLQAVDVALSLSGEYSPGGWQARIEQGHLQSGTKRMLEFTARAGRASAPGAALVATSRFTLDVVGALAQPVTEPYRMVQSGAVAGDVIVALSDRIELAGEVDVSGLVANTGEVLPRVALKIRADRAADGRIETYLPILVTRDGRASDLTLKAQLRPEGDTLHVDAALSGQHVFVQDVQLLAAPFAGPDDPSAPAPDPREGPPWRGVQGKLVVAIGTVVYTDALRVNQVEGEFAITPELLRIARLQAAVATGGTFGLTGALQFDAQSPSPYMLQAGLVASNVEVGELMRVISPNSAPPVEGRFDLTSTINGRAADLSQLMSAATAEAKLSSRGGTLRALPLRFAEAARTGGTLADVVGVIGGLTGNSRVQRVAEGSKAAAEFAQAVGALAFDQLNIEVSRQAAGEIAIKDISLISPMIRLLGSGGIASRPDTPFWQDPLKVRLQLSARGAMAQHLRTLRLLQQQADNLGYVAMVEDFNLEGSLLNLSAPHLQSLISRAISSL
jgi:hypothetical protein